MDPQFAFFDNPLGGFLKSCPNLQSGEGRFRRNGENGSRSASLDTLVTATKFVMVLTDRDNDKRGKTAVGMQSRHGPDEAIRRLDQMAVLGSVFSPGVYTTNG